MLVTTKTKTKPQVIRRLKASRNMLDNRLERAFVDNTVYPPKRAQIPTSIPIYLFSQREDRARRTSTITKAVLREV